MSYAEKVIDAFGGVRALASALGKTPSTVQGWKDRGSIPDTSKALIWSKASEMEISLTALDFLPFEAGREEQRGAA